MPQVFFYLRNADVDKWRAIEKKSLFIHEALNGVVDDSTVVSSASSVRKSNYAGVSRPTTKQGEDKFLPKGVVKGSDFVPKPPDPETGYPCCVKRSPCKHWTWDSDLTAWVNSLTGKTRDE